MLTSRSFIILLLAHTVDVDASQEETGEAEKSDVEMARCGKLIVLISKRADSRAADSLREERMDARATHFH